MERWLDIVRLRLRSLLHRRHADEELQRELRSHIDLQVEEHIARGMSSDEARREALRLFGGMDNVTEEARDARGVSFLDNLMRDLRYTLRGLLREPILLLAATTSIALGAGGNIAVLSLAKEFLFATPDARRPEELVQMRVSHGSHATWQRWLDLDASGALAAIAGYSVEKQVNWLNGDAAVSITPILVTPNFFDVTGVPVARGRAFTAAEARADRDARVAVVSDAFWLRELQADPAVLGRGLVLNGESYTVVGVLPARLRSILGFSIAPDVYVPANRTLLPEMLSPDARVVQLVGRLKPGQELAQGRAQVNAADRRLGRLEGDTVYAGVQEFAPIGALTGKSTLLGAFFALLGLVSLFVLLIACANVAGLLIARGTARRREIAIRLALGGTRARLMQQFLVEGFWLSLLGTAGGLALSVAFMRFMNGVSLPLPLPFELHLAPDATILAGALGLVFLSTVLCSLLPALGATRLALSPALKREEPQYATRRFSARAVLLAGQVTVSTVLLVTAFLFVRNLQRTQFTNPGFEVENALVAELGFVQAGSGGSDPIAILDAAVERVRALPGVESAAYSDAVPLTIHGGSTSGTNARIDGSAESRHIEYAHSQVGPGYFATSGTRVLQGREFLESDREGSPAVAVVNEEFVRRYFEGRSPIGSRVQILSEFTPADFTVVGVVGNGKYRTLGEEQRAAIFRPLRQHLEGLATGFVVARTVGDPLPLVPAVRKALGDLDRSVAVDVKPMRSALSIAILPSQVGATVLGSLGALGLVLAMFGLYAIVSYTVSRRVSEIAIRVALGATNGGILRLVIRDATVLVGVGLLLGLTLAALVTRPLATFLVTGLSATDPLSFAGTALMFVLVSVLASWWPARRATRVSPVIAMRLD